MYRTICTELWTDPEVKRLQPDGKLLFAYLITNPATHLCGIYSIPMTTLTSQTGLSDRVSRVVLDTLSNARLAYWDNEREIVFVVNMFDYQGQGPKNEQAAANHLQTLHHSPLCEQFLQRYPNVLPYLKKPERIKRESVSPSLRFSILTRDSFTCQYCGTPGTQTLLEVDHIKPVSAGGTDDPTNLLTACLCCNQGKGTDRVSELEKRCPSVSVPVLLVSSSPESDLKSKRDAKEFEQFWLAYPKKVGKKAALKAWERAKDMPAITPLLSAIASQRHSEQWTKENGQFIPHPSTWINEGRWSDESTVRSGRQQTVPPFPPKTDPIARGQWRAAYGDPAHHGYE